MEYILQKRVSDEATVREEIMPKLLKKKLYFAFKINKNLLLSSFYYPIVKK